MVNNKIFFLTLAVTLFLTVIFTRKMIVIMTRKKIGQSILEVGPSWHKSKEGTPTMGGVGFLLASTVAFLTVMLLFGGEIERQGAFVIINVFLYGILNGAVGLIDDIAKYRKKRNEGLTPLGKLAFQSVLAILFLVSVGMSTGISTTLRIPFTSFEIELGFFYYVFAFLVLCGVTNAVNLTDGIDGLASTCVLSVGTLFAAIELVIGVDGSFGFFGGVLMGAAMGFLVFNLHPAKIFMGDTGSLFFGAIVASVGIATNNLLTVLIYSFVFLCEAASDILQVAYFKITKGKRLFKMAPLHHHFEKCGYSEMKIVGLFGLVCVLFCGIAAVSFVI